MSDQERLLKLMQGMPSDELRALKEAAEMISQGVDTLKYDRRKRKLTATKIDSEGNVNRMSRRYSYGGEFTVASRANYTDKAARDAEIRSLYLREHLTQTELSEMFGVSQSRIHGILKSQGTIRKQPGPEK